MEELRKAFNIIIANDDDKEKFKVLSNTLMNLHDASKPEVFELGWHNEKICTYRISARSSLQSD